MTLDYIFDQVDSLNLMHEFFVQYLEGADRKSGIFHWRDLTIPEIPEYLNRISKSKDMAHSTWRQLQKSLRWLVLCAYDNQICSLPEHWFVETNTRDRRTLWCVEWKETAIATIAVRRMTPDNASDERIQEWVQLTRTKNLLQQARKMIARPARQRLRNVGSTPQANSLSLRAPLLLTS